MPENVWRMSLTSPDVPEPCFGEMAQRLTKRGPTCGLPFMTCSLRCMLLMRKDRDFYHTHKITKV